MCIVMTLPAAGFPLATFNAQELSPIPNEWLRGTTNAS